MGQDSDDERNEGALTATGQTASLFYHHCRHQAQGSRLSVTIITEFVTNVTIM